MRIAMIALGESANAQYRVYDPADALRARGHRVFTAVFEELRARGSLLDFDVVYGWRIHSPGFARVARLLAERDVGFVWDNDDNLSAIDVKGRTNHRFFTGLNGHRILAEQSAMMRMANLVTTPSAGLADHFRGMTDADVRVIENYVGPISPRTVSSKPQRIVIGWVAHMEHQTDIERLRLQEPLQRLLDRHPHVHVASIGCGLGLKSDRYHHERYVPFEELRGYVASFDIGLAPIVDSAFNRSRSNVKVKEYAALGIPWLASPIGPYAALGSDEGGCLVADDRWYEELERLVLDGRARRKLAKRGVKWARRQTIEENVHVWEATFQEAAERAGRRV
jgi:glycosyltransferase involved in cell wall biosynthesis